MYEVLFIGGEWNMQTHNVPEEAVYENKSVCVPKEPLDPIIDPGGILDPSDADEYRVVPLDEYTYDRIAVLKGHRVYRLECTINPEEITKAFKLLARATAVLYVYDNDYSMVFYYVDKINSSDAKNK